VFELLGAYATPEKTRSCKASNIWTWIDSYGLSMLVRDNLAVETLPMRIGDIEVKHLGNKQMVSVKITWGGPARGNAT
jgi:hypothetical protein